jgi:hypothetical protein
MSMRVEVIEKVIKTQGKDIQVGSHPGVVLFLQMPQYHEPTFVSVFQA